RATYLSVYFILRAVSPSLTTETKPWPCYSAAQTKPWLSCSPASTRPSTKLSSKTFTLTKSTRSLDIPKLASVHFLPSRTLRIIHKLFSQYGLLRTLTEKPPSSRLERVDLSRPYEAKNMRWSRVLPYRAAKAFVSRLGIKRASEHRAWHRDTRPTGIPAAPEVVYEEWAGWPDFLGTGAEGR